MEFRAERTIERQTGRDKETDRDRGGGNAKQGWWWRGMEGGTERERDTERNAPTDEEEYPFKIRISLSL